MLGFGARLSFAFRCFFALLFEGRVPDDVLDTFRPVRATPPESATAREDVGDRAVQILAILQRDARLIDFLQEDLGAYADAQVGAAVRDVHANSRAALARYLTVAPLLGAAEGDLVRPDAVADPVRVKIIGTLTHATGQTGVVRHRGWQVTSLSLPPLGPPDARRVLAPAEVEVS